MADIPQTGELFSRHNFFRRDGSFYAPCGVWDYMKDLNTISEETGQIRPFIHIPFLGFVLIAAYSVAKHKRIIYDAVKLRFAGIHHMWHWFDVQTHLELKRNLPLRMWTNRPHWYTYRGLLENRTKIKAQQMPAYQYTGWPLIAYIPRKNLRLQKRCSYIFRIFMLFAMVFEGVRYMSIESNVYISGYLADVYDDLGGRNFNVSGNITFCSRDERMDVDTVESMIVNILFLTVTEIQNAGAGLTNSTIMLVLCMCASVIFAFSHKVTFAPDLKRPRTYTREYDYQFMEGRTAEKLEEGLTERPEIKVLPYVHLKHQYKWDKTSDISKYQKAFAEDEEKKKKMRMEYVEKCYKRHLINRTWEQQRLLDIRHAILRRESRFDIQLFGGNQAHNDRKLPTEFPLPVEENVALPSTHVMMIRLNFIFPLIFCLVLFLNSLWDAYVFRRILISVKN